MSPSQIDTTAQIVRYYRGVGKNYERGCRTISCAPIGHEKWPLTNQIAISARSCCMHWKAFGLWYQHNIEFLHLGRRKAQLWTETQDNSKKISQKSGFLHVCGYSNLYVRVTPQE